MDHYINLTKDNPEPSVKEGDHQLPNEQITSVPTTTLSPFEDIDLYLWRLDANRGDIDQAYSNTGTIGYESMDQFMKLLSDTYQSKLWKNCPELKFLSNLNQFLSEGWTKRVASELCGKFFGSIQEFNQ